MLYYSERLNTYLSHAENRIKNCQANELLFSAKGDNSLAEAARISFLSWVGKAQDWHQEDHF